MPSRLVAVLVLLVLAMLPGCAYDARASFQQNAFPLAAFELDCPREKTVVRELGSGIMGVEGCGHRAVYLDNPRSGSIEDTAWAPDRRGYGGARWHLFGSPAVTEFPVTGLLRAVFEMECSSRELTVSRLDDEKVGVEGCGKRAVYVADDRTSSSGKTWCRFWRPLWIRPSG